jgi:hypothetical protein
LPIPQSAASSVYSTSTGDDRLDPALRQRLKDETQSAFQRDLHDDEDYSRRVLGVRYFFNREYTSNGLV